MSTNVRPARFWGRAWAGTSSRRTPAARKRSTTARFSGIRRKSCTLCAISGPTPSTEAICSTLAAARAGKRPERVQRGPRRPSCQRGGCPDRTAHARTAWPARPGRWRRPSRPSSSPRVPGRPPHGPWKSWCRSSPWKRRHLLHREPVEVGRVAHQACVEQRGHELLPHELDVHDRAAHPVHEALGGLGGAVDAHAAVGDLAVLMHHGAAAARAVRGHLERRGVGGPERKNGPHNLGDDVACLVDHHRVAHANVLAVNLVDVVQRRARDGGAGDHHGVELGHGGEHAGAADLDRDVAQDGLPLLGRELEGGEEARGARGETEVVLEGEGVDLHHHAVDVVRQAVALAEGFLAERVHLVRARAALDVAGSHGSPPRAARRGSPTGSCGRSSPCRRART